MNEKILCASIWYKDFDNKGVQHQPNNIDRGIVVSGWRHGSIITLTKAMTGLRSVIYAEDAIGESEQGFLTSFNRFVSREEALTITIKENQVKNLDDIRGNKLYSEDLY